MVGRPRQTLPPRQRPDVIVMIAAEFADHPIGISGTHSPINPDKPAVVSSSWCFSRNG
jgi:hypothetical protein